MNKENKVIVIQNIIMSIFFGLVFTLISQIVYEGGLHFDWYGFWLPVLFGTIFGYLVISGLPIAQWGISLACKLKAKPGSFLFSGVVSFVIAIIFVPIMTNVMGIFSSVIIPSIQYDLSNVAPAIEIIKGTITFQGIPLFFIIAWPIALIVSKPSEIMARSICKVDKK